MNLDKFTTKAAGLVQSAHANALASKHQQLMPVHLLNEMITDGEGFIEDIIASCGGDFRTLSKLCLDEMSKLTVVEGANVQVYMGQEFAKLIADSEALAKKKGDKFITTERILQVMLESPSLAEVIRKSNVSKAKLETVVESMRAG